jgi:hypothetical protein
MKTSSLFSSAAAEAENRESAHALPANKVAHFFIDVSSKPNVARRLLIEKQNDSHHSVSRLNSSRKQQDYFTFSRAIS